MIDLLLRFNSQQDMMITFRELSLTYTDDDGIEYVAQGGHQYALWEVGHIPGREGWHVNIRIIDPNFDVSSLEPYQVFPANPVCVWA
jgi:hypothetical protein